MSILNKRHKQQNISNSGDRRVETFNMMYLPEL